MPVEHAHTFKAGTIAKRLLVYARDLDGGPRTGLRADTPGATLAYIRAGEAAAVGVELRDADFVEVDSELVPGVYHLAAPDAMLAEGTDRAVLVLRVPGARVEPIEVQLVAYDPQDPERMGVTGLSNRKRHEFLRQALPRFTEMELELGRQLEQELTTHRGDSED
jgi:hypothetical protein